MRAPPAPPACVVCGAPDASPREGHRFPLCSSCRTEWNGSQEHARAATAMDDFVRRRRAELARDHEPKKVEPVEPEWP